MILLALAVPLSLVLFFLVRRRITAIYELERDTLIKRRDEARQRHAAAEERKRGMIRERNELERERIVREHELDISREAAEKPDKKADERRREERAAEWLLVNGHVSMEEYQRAQRRQESLSMDFISTCLALGYIDEATAKRAKRGK